MTPHQRPSGRELSSAQLPWMKPKTMRPSWRRRRPCSFVEAVAEVGHLLPEDGGGVVVVVNVDLDVGGAGAAERGERVEDLGPVLLLGVEAGETGALAGGIARSVFGDAGPAVLPGLDTAESGGQRIAAERLVMIGDGDPHAPGGRASGEVPGATAKVAGKPEICVFGKVHDCPDAKKLGALP